MIYTILGFFYVLFRMKPRYMVQFHLMTGPSTYSIEKHRYFFERVAAQRMVDTAQGLLQQEIANWTLYLFDTKTSETLDFIGAFYATKEEHLLSGNPDAKMN